MAIKIATRELEKEFEAAVVKVSQQIVIRRKWGAQNEPAEKPAQPAGKPGETPAGKTEEKKAEKA